MRGNLEPASTGGGGAGGATASGSVVSGALGDNVVFSGNIASGQINNFHIQSGGLGSGSVGSGQLADFHFASGARIDSSEWLADNSFVANELISGGKAVCFNQSGQLLVAKAGTSGLMPAVGITASNYVSGTTVIIYRDGRLYSTLFDFSGWMNRPVYVGVSGDIVASGAPSASGDVSQIVGVTASLSGIMVVIGDPLQGAIAGSGDVGSGAITGQAGAGYLTVASGTLGTYDAGSGMVARAANFVTPLHSGASWTMITGEIISGVRAVQISQSGFLRIAMASLSGRMPMIGVVVDGVLSGISANVYTMGMFQLTSGMADYSGYVGRTVWVGRSGQIVQWSGSFNSGGFVVTSGTDIFQRIGVAANSGGIVLSVGTNLLQFGGNIGAFPVDPANAQLGA